MPDPADGATAGGKPRRTARVADGRWVVQSDGTIRNTDFGYDRLVTIGQASTVAGHRAVLAKGGYRAVAEEIGPEAGLLM